MSGSNVISFGENSAGATYAEGLAFINRTRRHLDRFEQALPHQRELNIAPEDAATLRHKLDELEASLRKDLNII
jgi:hypothetical protein